MDKIKEYSNLIISILLSIVFAFMFMYITAGGYKAFLMGAVIAIFISLIGMATKRTGL